MPTLPLFSRSIMEQGPVIPVVVIDDAHKAINLASALYDGGINVVEVTLRTSRAIACVEQIATYTAQHCPDMVVGVGTIRQPAEVLIAKDAGAQFLVSPGYVGALGKACQAANMPLLPGVATSSEIIAAFNDGFREMKFFPAVPAGGVEMLKAFAGPFVDIAFCPTGGIHVGNASEFLALPNVLCVGGSWLTPAEAIRDNKWSLITGLAKAASQLAA